MILGNLICQKTDNEAVLFLFVFLYLVINGRSKHLSTEFEFAACFTSFSIFFHAAHPSWIPCSSINIVYRLMLLKLCSMRNCVRIYSSPARPQFSSMNVPPIFQNFDQDLQSFLFHSPEKA